MTETFFEEEVGRGGVPRDAHGNALILPANATTDRLVPYTAASALADFISDDRHIHRWEMRYLAKGMGQSPDLCELAACEPYSTGFDGPTGRDKSSSGRRLDAVIERALDRVGIHERADYGSAVHAWTEPGNGQPVSERARADVESFDRKVREAGIKIVATEVFTANDWVQAAGTFDHLCWVPGYGYVICDKKTGKMDWYHFGIQLSVYARGDVYDPATRKRAPLESLTGGELVNRDVGIVFAIKDGKTELKEVDLVTGFTGAEAAARAREYLQADGMGGDAEAHIKRALKEERSRIMDLLRALPPSDYPQIWRENKHLWTDDLTAYAKERAA